MTVSGFGANSVGGTPGDVIGLTNGTWTFNTYTYDIGTINTPVTNNVLDLTDGTGYGGGIGAGVARTAFYNTPVPVNASFNATFTYTPLYGTGNSNYDNGFAFILTSSSNIEQVAGSQRGFAIGPDANNGLEYDGAITPSVEIDYDVFQGSNAVGQPSARGPVTTRTAAPTRASAFLTGIVTFLATRSR